MLKGKVVRIRFRKDWIGQPCWVFFGRVLMFSKDWLAVDGKGVLVFKRQAIPKTETVVKNLRIQKDQAMNGDLLPAEIDRESRMLIFPREVISNIRILPDNFDMDNLRVIVSGRRIDVEVDGAPNTSIDEITEG